MRVLTQRELNRAVLARQRLLERAPLELPAALEALAGIQAQYAPSMYVGLWSRLAGFERDALTRALETRTVVQATLMRSTIHLVSRADFWPFALATRAARRRAWLRTRRGTSAQAMAGAARALRRRLEGGATLHADEAVALVGRDRAAGAGHWVDLVRAPPSGTWERRRANLLAAAEDWVGPRPDALEERAAMGHLVARYLAAFGPASRHDVQSFTGLAQATLRVVLGDLELRRFESEAGEELLDVPDGILPGADAPAPPRLLPTWDAILLVHARRTGVLPEAHRPKLFSPRTPQSRPSFLVDGAVAGTWRWTGEDVELAPFAPLPRGAEAALREEAAAAAAWHRG